MIPCDELRRHLMDFHYGLLCEWETDEIVRHLRRCPECRVHDAQARREIAAFDRWKVGRPPAHLWTAMEVRLRLEDGGRHRRPSGSRRWAPGYPPIAFAPAAVAVLMIAVLIGGWKIWSIRNRPVLPIDVYAHDYIEVERSLNHVQFRARTRVDMDCWLETKTGFSTHSPNLAPEGFHLEGVRVCRLRSRPVGIWVYDTASKMTLLFERDDDGSGLPESREIDNGKRRYFLTAVGALNLLSWRRQGRIFTLVAPDSPRRLSDIVTRCLDREALVGLSASSAVQ